MKIILFLPAFIYIIHTQNKSQVNKKKDDFYLRTSNFFFSVYQKAIAVGKKTQPTSNEKDMTPSLFHSIYHLPQQERHKELFNNMKNTNLPKAVFCLD